MNGPTDPKPMTPKALRRLMRKPAVERPSGDPDYREHLLLRYIKGVAEATARLRAERGL